MTNTLLLLVDKLTIYCFKISQRDLTERATKTTLSKNSRKFQKLHRQHRDVSETDVKTMEQRLSR